MKAVKNQNQKTRATRGAANRGSAMLLAVGLLTILAMLGTTFLLISRMDRQRSEAITAKAPVDNLAAGIVSQVVSLLKNDLYITDPGGTEPYSGIATGAGTNAEQWARFVDYASDDPGMDAFLYYHDGVTAHFPNVIGYTPAGPYTSTDGNPNPPPNATLEDTYVMNSEGQTYRVAVSVLDTSSLINANIACYYDSATATALGYESPVGIDLYNFLTIPLADGGAAYNVLNNARGGNEDDPTPIEINKYIAHNDDLTPMGIIYTPFAIGDELYLRWLGSNNGRTQTGSLYTAQPLAANLRKYLTTYNVTRAIVRHPVPHANPLLDFTAQTELNAAISDADIYNSLLRMLTKLQIGTDNVARQKMATHFVANLNAYEANGANGWPWSYVCPDIGTYTAYGVIPQPVIVKAYAKFTKSQYPVLPPLGSSHDHKWLAAVEIFVPNGAITAGLTFKLAGQDITSQLPAAGTRKIFWNYGGAYTGEPEALAALPAYSGVMERVDMAGLTFYNTNTVKLEAEPDTGGGTLVVIDQVSSSDIGHNATAPTDTSETDFSMRDDNNSRARYNVAVYKQVTPVNFNSVGLLETDLATNAKYSVPLSQKASILTSIGEYLQIYFMGHSEESSAQSPFSKNILKDSLSNMFAGDALKRGRLDNHPNDINHADYASGDYPDVPAAAMLNEFFTLIPPDGKRDDTKTRIYGKININTATKEVLERLPWPTTGTPSVGGIPVNFGPTTPSDIAEYIIAYRDQKNITNGPQYATDGREAASGITGLRATSINGGFMSAGELAVPLADYINWQLAPAGSGDGDTSAIQTESNYVAVRDSLYNAVSNLISVNSDTFVVNIQVQLMDGTTPKNSWYYTAFIDRSGCTTDSDSPAILLNNLSHQKKH